MKKHLFISASLFTLLTTLSSCEIVGGIFKAGVWSGILVVVVIIGLIIFLISKLMKRG